MASYIDNEYVFNESQVTWGYRGDAVLWGEMKKCFYGVSAPKDEKHFKKLITEIFVKITGHELCLCDGIYIESLNKGGLSKGMVSCVYWHNNLIPLLLSKYKEKYMEQ